MTTLHHAKPVEILLVEDNEGDVLLTLEAFKISKVANNIHVVENGEAAMEYLHKEGEYKNVKTPDLILLDINLPKKDGKQVLKEIKEDKKLGLIPVVVLTSSKSERDVLKSYGLHANSYIIKPVNLEKFFDIVSAIEHFWFTVVVLPDEEHIKEAAEDYEAE